MAASPKSSESSGYAIVSSKAEALSRSGESKEDSNGIQNMIRRYTLNVREVKAKYQQVKQNFKREDNHWVPHSRINQTSARDTSESRFPHIKDKSDNKKAHDIQELETLTAEIQKLEKVGECLKAKLTEAKQFGEEYVLQCQKNQENIEIIKNLKKQIGELEKEKKANHDLIATKAKRSVDLEGKVKTMTNELTGVKNEMSEVKNEMSEMKIAFAEMSATMEKNQRASETQNENMMLMMKSFYGRPPKQKEVRKSEQPKKVWNPNNTSSSDDVPRSKFPSTRRK